MLTIRKLILQAVVIATFLIALRIFFRGPLWENLSAQRLVSSLFDLKSVVIFCVLTAALLILCQLRYWLWWSFVLIALAVAGSGIDIPQWFVFYPERQSIFRVSLTLITILVFWAVEKGLGRYIGLNTGDTQQSDDILCEDGIVMLGLDKDFNTGTLRKELKNKK